MVLIALATVATYARGLGGALLISWDDDRFIVDNEQVLHPSWDALLSFLTEQHMEAYHPLHMLSYWLDVPWVGPDALVIHAVSLGLWVATAILVFRVMRGLELAVPFALVATLFYALHPIQIEAVTWASGRKDVLAAFFACLTVLAHLKSTQTNDRAAWVARAFYVFAALSKTTVLPLPAVLVLVDVLLRGRSLKRAVSSQLPSLAIGVGLASVVLTIWEGNTMIRPGAAGGTTAGRALLVCASITHHLVGAVLPVDNSPVYPIYRDAQLPAWVLLGPAALLLGLIAAWRARAPRALFSLAAFALLLFPVMNLAAPMYWHWMDRYLSLPLLPLAFGVGAALSWLATRMASTRVALALGGVLTLLLAARTVDYEQVYLSDRALWEHATEAEPTSYYAWLKLGEVHRDAGEWDESMAAYTHAVEIAPRLRLAHAALFMVYVRRDEAELELRERSLLLTRRYMGGLEEPTALRILASDMLEMGYRDAALVPLERSIGLSPIEHEQLLHAAEVQREHGQTWLAEFYERRAAMVPPSVPAAVPPAAVPPADAPPAD